MKTNYPNNIQTKKVVRQLMSEILTPDIKDQLYSSQSWLNLINQVTAEILSRKGPLHDDDQEWYETMGHVTDRAISYVHSRIHNSLRD